MPSTFSLVTLAGALAKATGRTLVILEAQNGGGSQNLATALPSLTDDQLDIADAGPLILAYDDRAEAQAAFNAFTDEAREGYKATGSLVETDVLYVGEIGGTAMVVSNAAHHDSARHSTHSFRDGQLMTDRPLFEHQRLPGEGLLTLDVGIGKTAVIS